MLIFNTKHLLLITIHYNYLLMPGLDAVLFMSRTQFEFGPTQIDKSTPLDSDTVLFGRSEVVPNTVPIKPAKIHYNNL